MANFKKQGLQTCRSTQLKNFMQEIKLTFSPLSSTNQCVLGKAPGIKAKERVEIDEEDEIFKTVDEEHKASEDMEDLFQEPPHISRKFKFSFDRMQNEKKMDGATDRALNQLTFCKEQHAQVPLLKLDSFDDKLQIQQLQQQLDERDKEIQRLKTIIELQNKHLNPERADDYKKIYSLFDRVQQDLKNYESKKVHVSDQ